MRQIGREPALWLLPALGAAFFHKVLFLGHTFYFRDLYLYFLPQKRLLAESLRSGELPLWNPFLHGGIPYLADLSNSFFYPSTLLYLFLPTTFALNLDVVLHVVASAMATYLLARSLGLGSTGALVAGLIYGFCGYTLSLANLFVRLLAMPYLPLLFLFWMRAMRWRRRRDLLLMLGAGLLQVFAGAPEMVALSWALLGGWTLVDELADKRAAWAATARWLLVLGILGALVLGLAAIQLLPMAEMVSESSRGVGLGFDGWSSWSLHPKRLPELLVPGFSGPIDTLREESYWGSSLVETGFPYIVSLYFGPLVLVLAAAAFGAGADRLLRRFLWLSFGLSLFFALGRFIPLFELVYELLPPLRLVRYPIKFLNAGILPIALLAGLGLDRIAKGGSVVRRATILLSSLGALLLGASLLSRSTLGPELVSSYFNPGAGSFELRIHSLTSALTLSGFLALAAAGTLLAASRAHRGQTTIPRWAPLLLAGVVALDLLAVGRSVNPTTPKELVELEPAIVHRAKRASPHGRLFRAPNPDLSLIAPAGANLAFRYRFHQQVLSFYLAHSFGIPTIFHTDFHGLAPRRTVALTSVVQSLPWDRKLSLLSAAGVETIVTADPVAVDHGDPGLLRLEDLGEIENSSTAIFKLFRNPSALSKAALVTTWLVVQDEEAALRAMLAPGFDARQHAVIEGAGTSSTRRCVEQPMIEWIEQSTTRWALELTTACDGYLVFTEPFYPAWQAKVDGEETEIQRANVAFSAIRVPSGHHTVERFFSSRALGTGTATSLSFLLLAALLLRYGELPANKKHQND